MGRPPRAGGGETASPAPQGTAQQREAGMGGAGRGGQGAEALGANPSCPFKVRKVCDCVGVRDGECVCKLGVFQHLLSHHEASGEFGYGLYTYERLQHVEASTQLDS